MKTKTLGAGLRTGDLLFVYRGLSDFSQAVSRVGTGLSPGRSVYHVGISDENGSVWEASQQGVRAVVLETFVERAGFEPSGLGTRPLLFAGRLRRRWRKLVPAALAWIRAREGLPYNDRFGSDKT